ncbi:MAG: rhodanese-like domain-containing protein [Planctomycetota bacterium]|nr:rhodanese-like domain-containing protein [Planctomycetota bacterium]
MNNPVPETPPPESQQPATATSCGGLFASVIVIMLFSMGAGLVTNSIRDRGSINLSRNYFQGITIPPTGSSNQENSQVSGQDVEVEPGNNSVVSPHPDDGIQRLTFEEVQDNFIVGEEEFEASGESIYLFVDARVRDQYEDGHIPGSIWLYHYESENLIDEVRSELEMAFFIIVYCNGGDCEDSLHLAADLMSLYNLPPENIYVYEGGLNEWKEKGMPVTVGSERR